MKNQNLTQLSPVSQVLDVSEERLDKNDKTYKLLRLRGMTETKEIHGGIEINVKTPGRKVSITQYEESYLDNEKEPFFDAQEGDFIAVEIYQAKNLKPYEIIDNDTGDVREVNSYTFPVVRGQNPETVLKNANHEFEGAETTEEAEDVEMPSLTQ